MKSFTQLIAELNEARMVATGDYRISSSGRKVRRLIKVGDDNYSKADDVDGDGDNDADDEKAKKMRGESVVPSHMQGKQKPYVSSDGKGNYEVLGNTGQTKATFSRKEHGKDAQKKAQAHLRSKYDEYMKEEVELDENTAALQKKASATGVSLSTLKKVYARGVAAWNSGHRPGTTPQQWGMARVNSYVTKGKGTYHGADKDLHEGGEPTEFNVMDIEEACWDTHKQVGMKKKGNKMVPDCVPKESVEEDARIDKKEYHKGLSDKTAAARVSHWKKMDKLSDKNPDSYKPAPGDATAKTIPSTHTKKYHAMYGEETQQEAYSMDDVRRDAADHIKKSIDKQSDDRIAALKDKKKPEGFLAKIGRKQINMVKGAYHGLTKESCDCDKDDVPFDKPYTKASGTTTDKSGAKHDAMSKARHLARMAIAQQKKKKQG